MPQKPLPVIMDCDPGNDDAVALLIAMASPEDFTILGITCVGGNVSLEQTASNARKICELAGRPDIPVYMGAPEPLVKGPIISDGAHGLNGMEGNTLPEPRMPVQKGHAVSFIIDTLRNCPQKVTLMPTGPLTNIALALKMAPDIKEKVDQIVFMGGAITAGNITPAAEFNMFVDPHAGQVVLSSGLPITMIGLDVTHKITATPGRLKKLRALGNEAGKQVADMLECTQDFDITCFEADGRHIHDACVPIFLLKPDLFRGRRAYVSVDTQHADHMGNTIVSFYPKHTELANAFVPADVDADGVFELILQRLSRYNGHGVRVSEAYKNMAL